MSMKYHIPVLTCELIDNLMVRPGGQYIDCTFGEAGHSQAVLESTMPRPNVLAIDLDGDAITLSKVSLYKFRDHLTLVNGNFKNLKDIAESNGFSFVDGVFFDLGLSSMQLEAGGRGFSFKSEDYLDMRFDRNQDLTAWEIVNNYSETDISNIVETYGEERSSENIAKAIVRNRPIDTSLHLSKVIRGAIRRRWSRINPATRTFQAIRMEVNGEMDNLESALEQTGTILNSGGRLAVISYHSLEDRLVKNFLKEKDKGGSRFKIVNKKVIKPSRNEIQFNRRSRSARMRVAERI